MTKRKKVEMETSFAEYFDQNVRPDLRSYFSRVEHGQMKVFTSPFFEDVKPFDDVMDKWATILMPKIASLPGLVAFENGLRAKVGPTSVMKPLSERMSDIDAYYDGVRTPSEPVNPEAIKRTQQEFSSIRGVRMRSQQNTVKSMKLSTNSGSPYWIRRRLLLERNLVLPVDVYAEDLNVFQTLNGAQWHACAALGWRGQEGGPDIDDVKQRVVWMFPFAVNIAELQVYQPLKLAFQRSNLVAPWVGTEAVNQRMTKLLTTKDPNDVVICTDFTKFDQHFGVVLQQAAKSLISYLMTPNTATSLWLDRVFPIKYMIPLAYDFNKIRYGLHGMGSGSGGTNDDETLAHRCLQHEAALEAGAELNPNSMCLGDDGCLSFPGATVDSVIRTYTKHGLIMNPSKQEVSDREATFLRRWHSLDYQINNVCVGVYSTFRALGRLRFQERFYDSKVWGPKMVALRALSILENCKYHPAREEFLDFCIKGDKFRLGLDIPGFLDNIKAIAQESIDLIPDFMGYTKSQSAEADPNSTINGIENWWVVQALKSRSS